MKKALAWKSWAILIATLLLYSTWALAGAKEDLSITTNGACSAGGRAFVITNKNPSKSIHATITQNTVVSGQTTSTPIDVILQPNQKQQLGCSTQSSAGNFLVTWQVQSAQYQ